MKLKEKYQKIIPDLIKKFGYKSRMSAPKIEKVVINTGLGRDLADKSSDERKKIIGSVKKDLASITGQAPVLTKAKKSISAFSLREGMAAGAKVTLRGEKMYDFLEKLINVVLPRTRDFWGIDLESVDGKGNLTLGLREHILFPEISPEETEKIFGLEITVVTDSENKEEGLEVLRLMGFPFK